MSIETPLLFLAEPFKTAWENKNPFAEANNISQAAEKINIYREKEGRRTARFFFNDKISGKKSYFLKYHSGTGWKEILKNLIQFRLPVLGASNEYYAANKLKMLGVDTLTAVAYGCRGSNPAKQESFLITVDLVDTISLEDYCRDWREAKPALNIKIALIKKIAQAAKKMHESGINHRDFYLCHFLLDTKSLNENLDGRADSFNCYLIDLHRCQLREKVPRRWLVKDVGGLLYSTMDAGLSARDYFRFIRIYTGKPLQEALRNPFWGDVLANAEKLYQKDFGKKPPIIFQKSIIKSLNRKHP